MTQASLAYRKNEEKILRGVVPEKYLRIIPYISGHKILEIGSAEGVLALLLAKHGKEVTALERQEERHLAAQRLRDAWGMDVTGPRFIRGDIRDWLNRLDGFDTLVAVRVIYYLRDELISWSAIGPCSNILRVRECLQLRQLKGISNDEDGPESKGQAR